MSEFCPDWFTTEDFVCAEKINVFHKENMPCKESTQALQIKNYHVLARSYYLYNSNGKVLLRISADDYYKLYINSVFVCCGPAPSYDFCRYYNEIDITSYLQKGENIIAVHLYYQGLINRVWQSGDNRFGVGAQIVNDDAICNLDFVCKKCDAFSGEIVGYDTDFLENFDSRLFDKGWKEISFDDSQWKPMIKAHHDYSFVKQPTDMLSVYPATPKKTEWKNASVFIDMGVEMCATLKIIAKGNAGEKILLRYAEELCDDGSLRYNLRANCKYEESLVLSDGESVFEGYCFKGFRYVEIIYGDAVITDIKILCRHYPFDDDYCNPHFSDKRLESIFSLCKNTIKYAVQESYIDCPTREKGQYLGDAFVAAHSHVLLTGKTDMLEKCIEEFARTSSICKGIMAVSSCSLMQEIADYSLLFGELVMLAYEHNKSLAFLEKYYTTVKNIILHFKQYERDDGLLDCVWDKWNLVDWPEGMRDGYDFELSRPVVSKGVHNVINAMYIGAIKTLCKIEKLLSFDVSFDYKPLENAYINAFVRKNGLLADNEHSNHCSLHSNVYALYFDIVPDSSKNTVADYVAKRGMACGVYTSYFLLKSLSLADRKEDVFRLLVNDGKNGWLNMIREGATTCFEVWSRDQKQNASLCHPWATAPIPIILEDLEDYVVS